MSFIQNLKIRTKVLLLLLLTCMIGAGGVLYVSNNFKDADVEYSQFIGSDASAEIDMAIASQRLVSIAYDAYQVFLYEPDSVRMKRAADDYAVSAQRIRELIGNAIRLLPQEKQALSSLQVQAEAIIGITDKAVAAGSVNRDDEAKALLMQADDEIATSLKTIRAWINSYSASIKDKSQLLSSKTTNTIFYTLFGLAAVFSFTLLVALLVTKREITAPIERLRLRMMSLAAGQVDEGVPGSERRDELGSMAIAVSVFRDNAIAKDRLEKQTEVERTVAERERIEHERQKAEDAANTKLAVDKLGEGLQHLADGKVTHRIQTPFVGTLDVLRVNYNNSLEKLHTVLRSVGQNAAGIDAGANEIKSAADDLSRRTEQ